MIGVSRHNLWKKVSLLALLIFVSVSAILLFQILWSDLRGSASGTASTESLLEAGATAAEYGGEDRAYAVPVLAYGAIDTAGNGSGLSLDQFNEQMEVLRDSGYRTVTLEDFDLFLAGEKVLPAKSFLLTFDGGDGESFPAVDSVLSDTGFNAVMFAGPGDVAWLETRLRSDGGTAGAPPARVRWDIELDLGPDPAGNAPASRSDSFLTKAWLPGEDRFESDDEYRKRIEDTLKQAGDSLAAMTGRRVTSASLPIDAFKQGGDELEETQDLLRRIVMEHYELLFTQSPAYSWSHPGQVGPFINRTEVKPDWDGRRLVSKIQGGSDKPLPYFDSFERNLGWTSSFGGLTVARGLLTAGATEHNYSSQAFLDGTGLWQDYTFRAELDWPRGEAFQLLGRRADSDNYAACEFTANKVSVVQKVDGETGTLSESWHKRPLRREDLTVAIRVSGRKAQCLVDGEVVVESDRLSTSLSEGGIGFRTSDPEKNNSEIRVHSIFSSIEN